MNYSTKKPHLIPFLEQFIAATVLFIVLPAALVFSDIIEIVIADKYRGFVITLILILYFYYLLALFLPGLSVLGDLLTGKTISKKMVYVGSMITRHQFTIRKTKATPNDAASHLIYDYYLRVTFADNKGKQSYSTTFLHQMQPGKSYTVVYGKCSRILLSVLDDSGVEMLYISR